MQETEKDPKTIEKLSLIDASGNYLLALVNDLLNIARIESGKCVITPTRIEISSYIKKIKLFFPTKKNVRLSTTLSDNLPHSIVIDPLRLQQILINLLSNAFKLTSKGEITLLLDYDDKNLLIIVSHPGAIEKEYDNIDIEIGLSVVNKLVTLMNGSIKRNDDQKKNQKKSSLTVTLPMLTKEPTEPSFFS